MKIDQKSIPYSRQWVGEEEIEAVVSVLKSSFITQGPTVGEFEASFAKAVGARYAVAVSNGTAALHLSALALELKEGDEVITTPISFVATANAILYSGAKPVFADIEPTFLNIDPKEVAKKITRKTKAIFVVHLAGHPAHLEALSGLCKQHQIQMIEDCCHALGAQYQGKPIGNGGYSAASIFSFHPVKHITTGEGGMITTNDKKFYDRLCNLRNHGLTRDPDVLQEKCEGPWYYEMQNLGFNYRMTDIQAALGMSQLEKLDGFVNRRREIAGRYLRAWEDLDGVLLPNEQEGCLHSYHLFVLRLKSDSLRLRRREIFETLKKNGVGVQVHYIPIPRQPYYRDLGYRAKEYPRAEDYYESAISVPIFPKMSDEDVDFVIDIVKKVLGKSSK
jgi:UDP-4-amino-4,6-dideoxy-N-acetyl-beta-L-altrosamine transaminase